MWHKIIKWHFEKSFSVFEFVFLGLVVNCFADGFFVAGFLIAIITFIIDKYVKRKFRLE